MRPNDYDKIAAKYASSDAKPDKAFSILPTVLALAGNVKGKIVVDLGCGNGFFTRALAKQGAKKVFGLDNSQRQILMAKKRDDARNIEYQLCDIFRDPIPTGQIINAPFVLNYAPDTRTLATFIRKLYSALKPGGKLVLVFDDPQGLDLKRFGAIKTMDKRQDGSRLKIKLYDKGKLICTLKAMYYTSRTIKRLLKKTGFIRIKSHKPIISEQGVRIFGEAFWRGYGSNCELSYLTASKMG